MESIDALAKAINQFDGGMVLVSHDMRLISQVANEIWMCDNKTIEKYKGDIQSFKMDMRKQMGIEGDQVGKLRGDASTKKSDETKKAEAAPKKKPPAKAPEVIAPKPVAAPKPVDVPMPVALPEPVAPAAKPVAPAASKPAAPAGDGAEPKRYIPPHLRRKMASG
jgi:ATP-binding cassette subfamily F protein 2